MSPTEELLNRALSLAVKSYENSDLQQAKLLFQKTLELDPKSFISLHFLGIIFLREDNYKLSVQVLRKALNLEQNNADVCHHLGLAYKGMEEHLAASQCFLAATKLKPNFAVAHLGYADVMSSLGNFSVAEKSYNKAIEYNPNLLKAYNNLGGLYRKQSKLLEAIECYEKSYKLDTARFDILSNVLMSMASEPTIAAEKYIAEAKRYGEAVSKVAKPFCEWALNGKKENSRIKVGFVSGDLRAHSVAYFLKSWIDKINPQKIELYAYYNYMYEDGETAQLKKSFANWINVFEKSDREVAFKIHNDEIDILIDLSGHTAHNRLPVFAWKPAPIQVSWMGFFASTGVGEIDYFIGDNWNFPENIQQYYVEKAWKLRTSGCFSPPQSIVKVEPLPAIKNGYITFGCFHKVAKLNANVLALWVKILRSVPESKLIVKDTVFIDQAVRNDLKQRFGSLGIKGDRIICEVGESRDTYFSAYNRVDIGLDPFPFNGGTVNMESLWMGVPFVSLQGEDRISRRGAATLHKAGLSEFVADTPEKYIEIVKNACSDLGKLSELRSGLREKVLASSLYNGELMARDLEQAFDDMCSIYNERLERL